MISNIHYPCTYKGCTERIGQKAHEWCMKKNMKDLCFGHQPIKYEGLGATSLTSLGKTSQLSAEK